MNQLSCICIGLLALGALSAGCGGDESAESRTAELSTAATAMAEVDLPGCEVLATRSGERWELLRHPHDSALVIVTGDGCPVCVDTHDGALLHLQNGGLGQPVGLQSVSPNPGGEPSGDPGGGDTSSMGPQGRQPLAMMPGKRSLISDDPLPPPGDHRPVLVQSGSSN